MSDPLKTIGKYVVTKPLMKTGFSDIYIAKDPDIDARLAIKVFHLKDENIGGQGRYGQEFWLQSFLEEAKLLARLDHRHIVPVLDFGWMGEAQPFFVMPYITANLIFEIGKDARTAEDAAKIEDKLQPRAIAPSRAVEIWGQILSALSHLHNCQIIHRDIKPGNILLTQREGGSVKLCDFGSVKLSGVKEERSGAWIGTKDYMSPEQQESSKDVGAGADIYASGVIAYRMLTGSLPQEGVARLDAVQHDIPIALADLVNDCIASDENSRPRDADNVLMQLEKLTLRT